MVSALPKNLCLEINDQVTLAFILWHTAPVLQAQKQHSEAQAALESSLALFQSAGISDAARQVKEDLEKWLAPLFTLIYNLCGSGHAINHDFIVFRWAYRLLRG